MNLEQVYLLFRELGDQMGIKDLALDENGGCSFLLNESLVIELEYNFESGLMLLWSALGTMRAGQRKMLYPELLAANLFWEKTRGGTLGVDPITQMLFLCYKEYLLEPDLVRVQQIFERFNDAAWYWSQYIVVSVQ